MGGVVQERQVAPGLEEHWSLWALEFSTPTVRRKPLPRSLHHTQVPPLPFQACPLPLPPQFISVVLAIVTRTSLSFSNKERAVESSHTKCK